MKKVIALALLGALASFGLAACGDDDDSGAANDNVLHITEDEYSFEFEGDVDAGTVTFDIDNPGKEFHMLGICHLKPGKTVADAEKAASSEDEAAFGETCVEETPIDALGGGQTPGSSLQVTASGMEAGNYVAVCFLPDKDGRPHFTRGMIKGFEIAEGDEAGEIEGDVTYTSSKEKLSGPKEIEAGETTIKFVPEAGAPNEVFMLKLKDGKTADDVDKFFAVMDEGGFYTDADSPVSFLYFAFDYDKARSFTVDLTPGTWAISAGSEDSEDLDPDEDPHVIQFTVS